ncbi:pentatricopeptide repeat-containing protein At1g09900-like [Dendrobium catenatum]|uniref:Pentatricopeptide repeat-containing protein n=1 Tax=Dendrobium catenatum TaxID=906689 RepID=A0A2I0XBU9_9ASPA|nr:pentatricopeptide repeat-containing protein At1g09900-like [Dendrobium catenatum]PKU85407.1 Pentatricopeptide repeat-containing protein [Dendrobium catenatum]
MAAWISSPFAAVARTAIKTLCFLFNVLHLPSRSWSSSRDEFNSADASDAVAVSITEDPETGILPFGESLLYRLSQYIPQHRHNLYPRDSDDRPRRCDRYNALMKTFDRFGNADEALRLLREIKTPNVICYTTAMDALVRAGRCEEAESVFSEMISLGIAPDSVAYSILVKMYCFHHKRFVSARNIIQLMVDRGCERDVVTYSTVIAGLCRAGKVDDAFSVLNLMLKDNCMLNAHTYTPIIQAYCALGKIDLAMELMEKMRSLGCPPDVVSYNVLIHAFCNKGDFAEVERILRESSNNGWEPDSVSYNTYISGLCNMGMTDEALKQLDFMLEKALQPTEVTLNIMLGMLCRDSKITEIIFLLARSFELGLDVGAASYNIAMTRLCEIGEFSAVLKLLSDMLKKGIRPDVQTFNIVIMSLCRAGKLHKAKHIFKSKGFTPDIVTCNILLHEFCLAGEFAEFHQLVAELGSGQVSPDAITYNIIVDGLCWDGKFSKAIEFVRSIDLEFKSDHVAHLAFGLVKGGRVGDLLRLLGEMIEKGLLLDVRLFEFMIQAFCKKGSCESIEIYKICLILDKMLRRE